MADVTLSKAVRSNLLNLQSTAELLGKTQERLATGLKVNSALDNPTNFFTASSLNSRASDLGRLLDSVSNAVQTIAAADKGVTALTKLVESAQATARQALQTAATVDQTSTSVSAQATGTGTVAIADDVAATVTASNTFTDDTAALATGTVDLGASTGTDLASTVATDEDTFTITIGSNTLTVGINDTNGGGTYSGTADVQVDLDFTSATVDDLISGISNAISGATAQGIDASFANFSAALDSNNNLAITTTDTNVSFTTAETTGTLLSSGFGIANDTYTPTSAALNALATAGATLDITSGSASDTLDFTNIHSVADFDAAVSALSVTGLTIASTSGNLSITADDNATSFTVADGSTTGAAAAIGVAEQDYDPSNSAIAALSGTLTFTTDTGTDTLTFGSSGIQTRADLETALAGLSTSGVTASINSSNFLTFTGANDESVTVGGTIDASAAFGVTEQDYDPTSTSTTTSVTNPKRDELRLQYNDLLDQIDQLAKDSGFNGVNLLNGDSLSVLFNEDGSSSLDITGVTFDSTGLGLSALSSGDFDTNSSINATLDDLKSGIDTLRTQASKFGSNLSVVEARQEFTKNMINVLQTGASNLTLADTNEEAANLLALQTRQQLSSTALSLASQSDQNVLRLF